MAIDFKDSGKNKRFNDFLLFATAAYFLHKSRKKDDEQSNTQYTYVKPEPTIQKKDTPISIITTCIYIVGLCIGYGYLWVHQFILCDNGFLYSLLFYFTTVVAAGLLICLFYGVMFGFPNEKNFPESHLRLIGGAVFMVLYILLFAFPAWYRNQPPDGWNPYYSILTIVGWLELIVFLVSLPVKLILLHREHKNAN